MDALCTARSTVGAASLGHSCAQRWAGSRLRHVNEPRLESRLMPSAVRVGGVVRHALVAAEMALSVTQRTLSDMRRFGTAGETT